MIEDATLIQGLLDKHISELETLDRDRGETAPHRLIITYDINRTTTAIQINGIAVKDDQGKGHWARNPQMLDLLASAIRSDERLVADYRPRESRQDWFQLRR